METETYTQRLYANHFKNGRWSGLTIIDAGPCEIDISELYRYETPQVVIGSNNEAIAVFTQKDKREIWRIYANRYLWK